MFSTEGVLREVSLPLMPVLKATVSAKANSGLWQLAQLTLESLDKNLSENNFSPSCAFVLIFLEDGSNEKAAINTDSTIRLIIDIPFFIVSKIQLL